MRIGKIASCVEYRMDEEFQNDNSWSQTLIFQIGKNLEIS